MDEAPALTGLLLRNKEIETVTPVVFPALADILQLDPVDDLYQAAFLTGAADPEADIVINDQWPLVFYSLDVPRSTIRLTKAPNDSLTIAF